jgi:hypothetical protein
MELSVIQSKIYEIRGARVMLDFDLAELYRVETRALNQSVKRNLKRFPSDFMFQLTHEEWNNLMSQFVISSWGGTRKLPYAFTEQGVAMLSGLLNSDIAIEVNISIMRAFVAIRNYFTLHTSIPDEMKELKERIKALEEAGEENQTAFDEIYLALAELAKRQKAINETAGRPRRPVGFVVPKDENDE